MSGAAVLCTVSEKDGKCMRIMGLDFGSKTVGVAISDPLLITAQGIEIVRRKEENKLRQTLARIEELITEYEVKEIVLGYPKHMNDSEGDRVALTKEFAEKLMRRTALPITFWDERLTTVAADRTMIEAGIRRENRKEHVDRIAAVLILQDIWITEGTERTACWNRPRPKRKEAGFPWNLVFRFHRTRLIGFHRTWFTGFCRPRLTEAKESRKEIWIKSNLAWKMAKRLNFMY